MLKESRGSTSESGNIRDRGVEMFNFRIFVDLMLSFDFENF